jgi:Cu(I)/Ag(I) efflux system membrane fusion protein
MSTDTNSTTKSSRRFGTPALALAIVATAIVAAGGTWLLTRPTPPHVHPGEDAATAAKEQWQCPMHPSIVQDHPGDCPICGMKLVKVAAAAPAPGGAQASGTQAPAKEQWQCPMHPSIVQDHPGDCPICGMKLVKMEGTGAPVAKGERKLLFYRSPMDPKVTSPTPRKDEMGMDFVPVYSDEVGGAPSVQGLTNVTIDPERQQLIGLKVAHADVGPVGGAWRTNGRVAMDETRVHHVNVKFSGFMEHVHGDFVGRPVKKGEPLFSIYSPELLAAQQEYLLALDTRKRLAASGGMTADGDALVAAARRKLELWDVPRSDLDRIQRTGEATRTVTFYSPATGVITKKDVVPGMRVNAGDMPFEIVDLSHVWVLADAYESDLQQVKAGMAAKLTLKAFPNRTFQGRVAFIDPLLDPKTRTAKVRIDVPNPTGELRPEMFGEVVLQGKARQGVRVPADAVIHSGTNSVVFVALGDGKFQPREVQLGETNPDFVEVLSGIEKGDGVVTRANFLIDSESRLRASLAALSSPAAPTPVAAAKKDGAAAVQASAKEGAANPHAGHGKQ